MTLKKLWRENPTPSGHSDARKTAELHNHPALIRRGFLFLVEAVVSPQNAPCNSLEGVLRVPAGCTWLCTLATTAPKIESYAFHPPIDKGIP